jgi:uncharacterized protein (TIGR03086 family)
VTSRDVDLVVLARGLDQAAELVGSVGREHLATRTPCTEWTVSELVDHLVAAPAAFARLVRGEEVDWSAPAPQVGDDREAAFRTNADALMQAWAEAGTGQVQPGPDWQTAELAVHAYDLASALGRPTGHLDREVAERGLAFMQANLKPEIRGLAFGPEQAAPDGADAYQRIAAFAGRILTPTR